MVSLTLLSLSSLGFETYLTMENDTFSAKRDSQYTHGTKIEVVTDNGCHFLASQTMYAPHDLRQKEHIDGDRPYCGMLLGGVGYEFFKDAKSLWTHYGELDIGIIGPAAGCKETQTFIHKLLDCRKPKGWDNQLHNEVVVNGQWWTKYNWYLCNWFAIVPRAGAAVGTIQDMVEVGCDVKIGWNMHPTVNNEIIFSASRSESWTKKLTAYVFAGVGERYYLYNHILEGSMFGHKDDGLDVDINPFVTEFRWGLVVKYDRFFATYYNIHRTDEYKHQPDAPVYGGIGIGWEL